ncbi:helix-turn-helix domain-containing protein [Peteryoungia ipomoeae]|uniref:Helix-turn-helix transcriptional regulator n=1 Tax=Peteryoungia ipomoeae TaxID=1210932 RepID=A0A4S8P3P7_9HYPH|nr:helix-turn-helix transcriptional regulator [Peteryoungia ipomoeae]THV22289.1 helix-turn-helix transcriptional regulator [Peteryoungia ipomoeae]
MVGQTPFSAVARILIDRWLTTSADDASDPEVVFAPVIDQLSIKMRLTVIRLNGDDPLQWEMKAIRHSGFTSRVLNINQLFADCRIGDFKDRRYMEEAVIPRLLEVAHTQQPRMELVKTKLMGLSLGYDRILLPQKNNGGSQWIISSSYARFLLTRPRQEANLDVEDEAITQLLIEGATAKEIASTLGFSHRTVEHRLSRMKDRMGARNTVHLVAMLMAMHLDRSAD